MHTPTDNSPLSITAFVQRFAGAGIGDMSLSVPPAALAAEGRPWRPVALLTGKARRWPMDSFPGNTHAAMGRPFAKHAQHIWALQPIKANSAGLVWILAAKPAAFNLWAQGMAA